MLVLIAMCAAVASIGAPTAMAVGESSAALRRAAALIASGCAETVAAAENAR